MGKCLEFVDGPKVVLSKGATVSRDRNSSAPAPSRSNRARLSFPVYVTIAVGMAVYRSLCRWPCACLRQTGLVIRLGVWTKGHTNSRSNLQINVQMQSLKN
jgi:hypothetical protein